MCFDHVLCRTERTYVRGLQELIDIYIKPAAAQVNLLGGVSSTKETVIPAAERRIVFSGLDSLFSFHKDIFLPALELAADSALLRFRSAGRSEARMERCQPMLLGALLGHSCRMLRSCACTQPTSSEVTASFLLI
jgi:hypothetical protein